MAFNPNAVMAAVKQLRQLLGDTQQQFAQRTGLAISTVVRYERSRPPKGAELEKLKTLAEKHGFQNIATVFAFSLGQDITPETAVLHSVMNILWWNQSLLKEGRWDGLLLMVSENLDDLIRIKMRRPDEIPESLAELDAQDTQLDFIRLQSSVKLLNQETRKILDKHPSWTWEKAWAQALVEHPELYELYLAEQKMAATKGR